MTAVAARLHHARQQVVGEFQTLASAAIFDLEQPSVHQPLDCFARYARRAQGIIYGHAVAVAADRKQPFLNEGANFGRETCEAAFVELADNSFIIGSQEIRRNLWLLLLLPFIVQFPADEAQ